MEENYEHQFTERDIADFAALQKWPNSRADMGNKLAEETGEVCGELNAWAEGKPDVEALKDEMGDVLIVMSQLAALSGMTLEELRQRRFKIIKDRAEVHEEDFAPNSNPFATSYHEDELGKAMQEIWDDHCADTGCIPCAFKIHGPHTTRVSASLHGSDFVRKVIDRLPASFWSKEENGDYSNA